MQQHAHYRQRLYQRRRGGPAPRLRQVAGRAGPVQPRPGSLPPQQDGRGQRRRPPQAADHGPGGRRRYHQGEAGLWPLGANLLRGVRRPPAQASAGQGHRGVVHQRSGVATRAAGMARPVSEIVVAIESFQPTNGNWLALDALLGELFSSGSATQGIDAMLGIFERYPVQDGAGIFWAIVHGLESLPGYESHLVESITRTPSRFALLMIHRLLNAGQVEVGSVNLLALLEQVAGDEQVNPASRQEARKHLGSHKRP